MNTAQFLMFFVYVLSVACAGIAIYGFLQRDQAVRMNRVLYLGECFLFGNTFLVAGLLLLSLAGLFKAPFLWTAVGINFLVLFHPQVRRDIRWLLPSWPSLSIPGILFAALLATLFFRNCYFLIDVDSLSTYLYAQQLWLAAGTSLIGDPTFDVRLFNPQFDAIAYSLGLSIFPAETLFPELINVFWRVIALLLVYGYASYRLNGYYALAAVLLVALNDHFFFSGANRSVVLNPAVIAFLFAAAYSFWEARKQESRFRLMAAAVFACQVIACKLYALYAVTFLVVLGLLMQHNLRKMCSDILRNPVYLSTLAFSMVAALLWYLKNGIITGNVMFPFLSGTLQIYGWTIDQQTMLMKINGGLPWPKVLKYFSFLMIWPGVTAAKYVLMGVMSLPLLLLLRRSKSDPKQDAELYEVCFWLGSSVLILCGLCLALWQDPRLYRFPIAVYALTVVFLGRYIAMHVLKVKAEGWIAGVLILLSLQGYKVVTHGNGQGSPTVQENLQVISDRLHTEDAVQKHYPQVLAIREGLKQQPQKVSRSAWYVGENSQGYLLPHRPRISVFFTTTIRWDDYASRERIISRLRSQGIEWVMVCLPGQTQLDFVHIEEFSRMAMEFERYPAVTYYDYGFPKELTKIQ